MQLFAALPLLLLAAQVLGAAAGKAKAASACSCDCCETAVRREAGNADGLQCSFVESGMFAASAPTCGSLCAKTSQDEILEAAASMLDTERFCFFECVPKAAIAKAAKSGDLCRPLSEVEKKAARDTTGNARPLPQLAATKQEVAPHFLAKKASDVASSASAAALSLKRQEPPAAEPWSSTEAMPSEVDKLVKEAKTTADDASLEAQSVQDMAYTGASAVPTAANAEEDARLAARFALNAEAGVRSVLEKAKAQAHAEAFGVLREVLPTLQQKARSAAQAEATSGPSSPAEAAQREQALEVAKAATKGLEPWTTAMNDAVKVKDKYAARGNELAKAAFAAEQNAQHIEQEARSWDAFQGPPAKRQAEKLHLKAKDLMAVASASDKQAQELFAQAKYIDSTLPSYARQAEQGAYHEMAMVSPDVPPPLPPLVLAQEKSKQ